MLRAGGALGHESKLPQQVQDQGPVMFERLCEQTQQKKFDAIWKKLDDLTEKHHRI
jgi:hypothetical protein